VYARHGHREQEDRVARADELRQEGRVEQRDLRVEEVGEEALPERRGRRAAAADASAQIRQPAAIPSVVAKASRRPRMNTLRDTIAMSAPGVMVSSVITPRKTSGSRTDSA
jgi:hypothetical protein